MRILVFNWRDLQHSWTGGGEIYIFEQAARWVKMGHDVTVFCGEDIEKKLLPFEIIDGIKIYRKGGRYSLYLWAIWYYFTKFRGQFDIVIDVENGIPFFTPLFCRLPKVCFVYHVHGKQFFYEVPAPLSHIGFLIERFIFPLLYKGLPIIAISQTTKDHLVKNGFNPRKIKVVYCGINGSRRLIKNPVKKFSHPTILYLGRIKKYKRVDLLVKIFPQILKKVPQARLIIAGWGTEASNLADLIMRSPYRRKITLMGPVDNQEKRRLLSGSWLFVNPSIGEGWSIAVIEANLHGTPAVAFRVPGLSESIKNDKTGLLANGETNFTQKISLILSDKNYCLKLGKAAQLHAQKYDWDLTSKKSLTIFKQELSLAHFKYQKMGVNRI